jgi:DNA-directed RNA polymerase specialized sigma subunit
MLQSQIDLIESNYDLAKKIVHSYYKKMPSRVSFDDIPANCR